MVTLKLSKISAHMELLENWEEFTQAVKNQSDIRDITVQSWNRCKELGINSENLTYKILNEEELKKKREANKELIKAAKPYLEQLSLSLYGIPHMVVLADSKGWIIEIYGTPEKLGGRDAGLCLGANWREETIGNNGIGTALAGGEPVMVYGIEHYNTVYHSCGCLGVPIRGIDDSIVGAIDISVPIEHAHPGRLTLALASVASIEQTLVNQKNTTVKEKDKLSATDKLLATAVHDLKNPMTVIKGLSQLGVMTATSEKEQQYFSEIVSQIDYLSDMMEDLLGLYRIESFKEENPTNLVLQVLKEITPVCKSKGINLSSSIEGEDFVQLQVKSFKRAIYNILLNAMQVLAAGEEILVTTKAENNKFLIMIKDNGPGILEDIQNTLFDPFVFGREGGNGLGLYMVKETATTHGGKIWFETKQGEGTTFFVELPISKQS